MINRLLKLSIGKAIHSHGMEEAEKEKSEKRIRKRSRYQVQEGFRYCLWWWCIVAKIQKVKRKAQTEKHQSIRKRPQS